MYLSKKNINKIFEFLEQDDDEAIQKLIDEGKAEVHPSDEFTEDFILDLQRDLALLREVQDMWATVKRDPKLLTLLSKLVKPIPEN